MMIDESVTQTDTWRVIGVSVEGTAHRRTGQPCQDINRWRILPNNCHVFAIADGAGSATFAEKGATLAAETAVENLSNTLLGNFHLDEDVWHSVVSGCFHACIASLVKYAEETQIAFRELATTLTCVAVTDEHLVVGQIGDGIAMAEDNEGATFVAVKPQRGEYANEVQLLTAPDAAEKLEIRVFAKSVRAVAATTDGLLRLAVQLPTYEPHLPFFRPLFDFVAETVDKSATEDELRSFLNSERVCGRTDDDKTLVLAVRISDKVPGSASESRTSQPQGELTR